VCPLPLRGRRRILPDLQFLRPTRDANRLLLRIRHRGRAASSITCRPVSLCQIPGAARTRNAISPSVADENPQWEAKNQNDIDYPIKHGSALTSRNAPLVGNSTERSRPATNRKASPSDQMSSLPIQRGGLQEYRLTI
jgi:hypothetical protein